MFTMEKTGVGSGIGRTFRLKKKGQRVVFATTSAHASLISSEGLTDTSCAIRCSALTISGGSRTLMRTQGIS